MWMDPGAQEVQDQLYNVVMDIATRYDVTGIHFDDYFYPYPVSGVDFPDDLTWNSYVNGGGSMSRADWRRDNVNKIVQRLYTGIRGLDSTGKRVRFSIGKLITIYNISRRDWGDQMLTNSYRDYI